MKSRLLKDVRKIDNLETAWRVVQSNARLSHSDEVRNEIKDFADDAGFKLRSIRHQLSRGMFKFPPAKGIPIAKRDARGRKSDKIRPIVLAPVESRIVQRALLNVLVEVPALIPHLHTPFSFGSCRKHEDGRLVGVPAAIQCVLNAIEQGAEFVACADIRSFFTRVPKPLVIEIIKSAVDDNEFISFLRSAIDVELWNMAQLRSRASEFPIEEIGVAQGNSLSL